ncbi:MAG: hypothetical protein H7Y11_02460 [Armatimonadetes bacterium]|nr:hypothetical protein [Anaerolineae bacterium]
MSSDLPLNPSPQARTLALQQRLDFTPQELALNQRGEMSERQYAALLTYLKPSSALGRGCGRVMLFLPLMLLAIPVGVFFAYAGERASAIASVLLSQPVILLCAAVLLVTSLLITLVYVIVGGGWQRTMQGIRESQDNAELVEVSGMARRKMVPGRYSPMLFIVINRKQLRVLKRPQFDAFQDGSAYRIHYIQLGPLPFLLSASVLDHPS